MSINNMYFSGCFVHHIIEELNKYCESSDSPKLENRLSLDSCTSTEKDRVTNACFGNKINSPENSKSAVEDASCSGEDGVLDNIRKKSQISDRVLGHFTKEQLLSLIVRNKHGERTSFCDMGTFCLIFSVSFSFMTWKYFVCMHKNLIQLFSMIFTYM